MTSSSLDTPRYAQCSIPASPVNSAPRSTAMPASDLDETCSGRIATTRPSSSFVTLPPEIHLAISKYLIYPDALALKHVNRYLYSMVDTDIELKIDWLMERRRLHLECPNDRRCELGSDLRFCRGSVPLLMQRRRDHLECEARPALGCLIFGTPTCPRKSRSWRSRLRRWLRLKLTIELRWLLLVFMPVMIGLLCVVGFRNP